MSKDNGRNGGSLVAVVVVVAEKRDTTNPESFTVIDAESLLRVCVCVCVRGRRCISIRKVMANSFSWGLLVVFAFFMADDGRER